MNPFAAAEEGALRTYLHSLDVEWMLAEYEEEYGCHPCDRCEEDYCLKWCAAKGTRK